MERLALQTYGAPLDEDRIHELEAHLGFSLPLDYTQFLRTCSGGRPRATLFESEDGEVWNLDQLYAIDPLSLETMRIDDMVAGFRNLLPGGVLPIGQDPGDNQVCLDLRKNPLGTVVVWDHETRECSHQTQWCFREFLEHLEETHPR